MRVCEIFINFLYTKLWIEKPISSKLFTRHCYLTWEYISTKNKIFNNFLANTANYLLWYCLVITFGQKSRLRNKIYILFFLIILIWFFVHISIVYISMMWTWIDDDNVGGSSASILKNILQYPIVRWKVYLKEIYKLLFVENWKALIKNPKVIFRYFF